MGRQERKKSVAPLEEHDWARGIYIAWSLLGMTMQQYLQTTPVLLHELLTAAVDIRSGKASQEPQRVEYADQIPGGW